MASHDDIRSALEAVNKHAESCTKMVHYHEARILREEALALIRRLPEGPERDQLELSALISMLRVLMLLRAAQVRVMGRCRPQSYGHGRIRGLALFPCGAAGTP